MSMDSKVIEYVMAHWHSLPWLNQVFRFITYLGENGIIWIALAIVLLCIPKTRQTGIVLALTLALDALVCNAICKPIIARARPYTENESILDFFNQIGFRAPKDYSFPSGHACAGFAAATCLTMWVGWRGSFAYILAGLIAFSRVFLCVHFLTDVLAGIVLGCLIGIIVALCYKHTMKKHQQKNE